VSPRKGATRKNLSMFLMTDGEAALFEFPEERAMELEGTLMGTSAGRGTVGDSAALACYCLSASPTRMTSRWPQLGLTTPLRSGQTLCNALSPPRCSAMYSQALLCCKPFSSPLWHGAVSSRP
jgi:hypothetical protein